MIRKKLKKILKYKDLSKEIQHIWNIKTKVIPVIIGTTGTISKSLKKYLSNIPGEHKIKELQKTVIWDTAHLPLKVLMLKYKTFNKGNYITYSMNFKYRIAAKLCTLEAWIVAGM